MQIEFNGDVYDVNVTSFTLHVEATHDDPAEGGEIEFDLKLHGFEIHCNYFTDLEWNNIELLIAEKIEKETQDNKDEYLSEMAADREDRF